ncbi:N-acetylglucosamine-binding protein GbpA [Pseudomonas sp. PDM05]|uniref:N-acetylglucosamine-binding protein GbpA n=1 Tax=Pseudomonas sp. PDM05 TaxID=2769301 RepID=UPI001787223B|nr:N-acetylglucosamine-binding protein GbpA [Pseudomonas sp. PDM05]MBD9459905.1 N-acetylglucosamine-binding protein GbpA [Pseudomonas sp. PDM05]
MNNLFRYMSVLQKYVLAACMLMPIQTVFAHGDVDGSRADKCSKGQNINCGGAQWERQSTGETYKGFPNGKGGAPGQGPVDGEIASGSNQRFAALDAQTATRWNKTDISDSNVSFRWTFTAPHPATMYEYFITKNGWNQNQPLTRASFDPAPFCSINAGNVVPATGLTHNCVIPPGKSGYHVILAKWTVGDTPMAFHKPIDVNIEIGPGVPGMQKIGSILPVDTLLPGDSVKARAFSSSGESQTYSVSTTIGTPEEGMPDAWPRVLAKKFNDTQTLVKAGKPQADGTIVPESGENDIYAAPASLITHYEIEKDIKENPNARMTISALPAENQLTDGKYDLKFTVIADPTMNVETTLFDAANKAVGTAKGVVGNTGAWLDMAVRSQPGLHTLIATGTTEDGRTSRQSSAPLTLTGTGESQKYDFVFPEQLKSYKAGTLVLQPKNGKVYECKPGSVAGWCTIWTPSATQYEPGSGSNWEDAWIAK